MLWLEEYRCGCTFIGEYRELVGYCPKHGENSRAKARIGRARENPQLARGLA